MRSKYGFQFSLVIIFIVASTQAALAQKKPDIVILATGGTIAGAAATDYLLPGCKAGDTPWAEQLAAWRQVLEHLAAEFLAGHAAVTPRPGACKNCDLPPLCRIGELGGAPALDEASEESEASGDGK